MSYENYQNRVIDLFRTSGGNLECINHDFIEECFEQGYDEEYVVEQLNHAENLQDENEE